MSQNSYTVGLKVKPPKIGTQKPQKSSFITFSLIATLIIAISLTVLSIFFLSLISLVFAGVFYAAYGLGKTLRNKIHKRDKANYHQQLSDKWVSSDGFVKMRDFLILMGFPANVAYEITDDLGTEIMYNKSYAQATGYYPLSSVEGRKVISAVQVETLLSPKGNIKMTAKVLQEI